MTGKIALEEHFAIPDYNLHRVPFLGDELWQQVQHRIVDFTEIRLPEMDRHGIDYAVISLTSPGVQGETDPAVAVERARRANDVLAEAVQAHPQRFGGFAAVALQDVDAAVAETTRAVAELGFHGVLVNSWTNEPNGGVGYLDESRFDPFWARLEELGVPLYLHPRQLPTHQSGVVEGFPALAGPVWEFAADCSATALRLILSGLFDRRPGLQVILGHLGEGLPYDIWRTENRLGLARDRPALRRTLTDYLRENVYLTTSGHFCTPSLRAALEVVGTERVMFSVDYPYESTEQAATWFDGLDLDPATHSAVAADNAVRLLGLKPCDAANGGIDHG